MYYPLNLTLYGTKVFPLFGDLLKGLPHVFDFSSENPAVPHYDTADFTGFQQLIFRELAAAGKSWGVGRYLEERRTLLADYPQMTGEGRFFHVGLDIVVPADVPLFAPIEGVVAETGFDAGLGNYGGYVRLRHEVGRTIFYSFYGHLSTDHVVTPGTTLRAGEMLGHIGAGLDSGGWFTHTHLQIITESAQLAGRSMQGYVNATDLGRIETLFPSPYPLFVSRP